MRRVALTSLAGTSIEWYDFYLYGTAAAVIFPKAFFPQDLPPMLLLIISFSTFAVGFIARPLGGVVFGHFGDQVGRKRTLVIALMMMGVATTLIGLLPTYQSIGIAAPLMLVALRFIQIVKLWFQCLLDPSLLSISLWHNLAGHAQAHVRSIQPRPRTTYPWKLYRRSTEEKPPHNKK